MSNIVLVGSGVVSIPPKRGGATELIIFELSKYLAEKNYNVTVFDIKERENRFSEIIKGAKYERFFVPRLGNVFFLRLSEFFFGVKCMLSAREIKPDILHAQTVFSSLPFAIFRKFCSWKFLYTSHNPAWTTEKNSLFNRIILRIEAYVIKRSKFTITVSQVMKDCIIKKARVNGDKIKVIHNFVDTKKFRPTVSNWKRRMKIEGPVVLFVGKLTENKGVDVFIRCAEDLSRALPDTTFVLVGPVNFEYETENIW